MQRKKLKSFIFNEEGQTTVEYVVFLAVLAAIILAVGRTFLSRFEGFMNSLVRSRIESFFRSNLYRFRM